MIGQNVLHIIAGEMNPEYFRMVFYIINVFLNLFRLVKNHVAGGDHFLHTIEPEVCFARCHIQNLIIPSTLLLERRQRRTSFQPIGTAATNNKRPRVVFEVQTGVIQIAGVKIHFGLPPLREILPESMKSFRLILQTH